MTWRVKKEVNAATGKVRYQVEGPQRSVIVAGMSIYTTKWGRPSRSHSAALRKLKRIRYRYDKKRWI